jgi:hypothetical protein
MVLEWSASESDLQRAVENSPALAEAAPLAANFRRLNRIILEALDALEKGSPQNAQWQNSTMAALTEIAKPRGALEIVTVSGAQKLVIAASGNAESTGRRNTEND